MSLSRLAAVCVLLAAGSPATVKKPIQGGSAWWVESSAGFYVALAAKYRAQLPRD